MDDRAVFLQPAFILRHRNFRESSLIMDVLTYDHGIVSILAKGVRKKKSASAGLLMPFTELNISFAGKSDLKTLTAVELMGIPAQLRNLGLYCGFYVNELVWLFLHKFDPCPEIYTLYKTSIKKLTIAADTEQTLRFFELRLLNHLGYGLTLTHDLKSGSPVIPDKRYVFESGIGITGNSNGFIEGKTLLALAEGADLNQQALSQAKRLMRQVLDEYLQGRVLKSREVLATIMKTLQ